MNAYNAARRDNAVAWNEADTRHRFIVPKRPAARCILRNFAFNAPVVSRRQRSDRVKWQQAAFFNYLKPEAREILRDLLEKYASDGELRLVTARKHLPEVLKVPPISHHGSVNEIIGKFGGADQLRDVVNQLQSLLYAS